MGRKGRALEQLITAIERAMNDKEDVKIVSPGRLKHRVTGRMREHDVLMIRGDGRHRIVTAIECRDRKRVVDDPAVEAFAKKCRNTGVKNGIMVSTKGFTPEALADAVHEGISCMTLTEATNFNWIIATQFEQFARRYAVRWLFDVGENANQMAKPFVATNGLGHPVPLVVLNQQAVRVFQEKHEPKEPSPPSASHQVHFKNVTDLSLRNEETGFTCPVLSALATVSYEDVRLEPAMVKLHNYTDLATGEQVELAQAEVNLGSLKGRFMMVPAPDGARELKLVVESVVKAK